MFWRSYLIFYWSTFDLKFDIPLVNILRCFQKQTWWSFSIYMLVVSCSVRTVLLTLYFCTVIAYVYIIYVCCNIDYANIQKNIHNLIQIIIKSSYSTNISKRLIKKTPQNKPGSYTGRFMSLGFQRQNVINKVIVLQDISRL